MKGGMNAGIGWALSRLARTRGYRQILWIGLMRRSRSLRRDRAPFSEDALVYEWEQSRVESGQGPSTDEGSGEMPSSSLMDRLALNCRR